METTKGRILLVDDDPAIRRAYTRVLESAGHRVEVAENGRSAAQKAQTAYDVIVSDIAMPGMDGVELLKTVRQFDLDVPVVLVTGQPQVQTAMKAVEWGAYKYLAKPVPLPTLLDTVQEALRLHQLARLKREAFGMMGELRTQISDRAGLQARFELAVHGLWMAYQPIVSWSRRRVVAYECLMRSDEPAMPNPGVILDAAERLGQLSLLGRRIRERCALAAGDDNIPCLFVNLHSADLLDEDLYDDAAALSLMGSHVVLEVTERASLDNVSDVAGRMRRLRQLGFRIAIDDLGVGYAGLTSFTQLAPEFAKLDMSLVRGIDQDPTKQKLVGSMVSLCRELNTQLICEGIETPAERDALLAMGCDLLQGYLFAKPARHLPAVQW